MAGALTVTTTVTLTGLGRTVNLTEASTMTVPVEHQEGYTVVTTATTTAIQLLAMVDHIALAKIYGIFLKAESGTIYVTPDASGTGTITATTAELILNEGESCWLPVNPNGTGGVTGCVVDAASTADAFSWVIVGEA